MSKPWKPTVTVYDAKIKDIVTVTLEVEVDWSQIAVMLARQAIRSKHGKSTHMAKALKAKIVKRDPA